MKTTNKYMVRLGQTVPPTDGETPSSRPDVKAPVSREIVMMQIRQILKFARSV